MKMFKCAFRAASANAFKVSLEFDMSGCHCLYYNHVFDDFVVTSDTDSSSMMLFLLILGLFVVIIG